MIPYGDTHYYIDLNAIEKAITTDATLQAQTITDYNLEEHYDGQGTLLSVIKTSKAYNKGKEIDGSKFSTINMLLDKIMESLEDEDEDMALGSERALNSKTLSFKIAFNSLLNEGIIKEKK